MPIVPRLRAPFVRSALSALTCLALAAPTPARAQDVQYKTVTKVDMGTGMNAMLKLAGASEFSEVSYLKGKKMRSDTDKMSTIFDLESGRYIILNHKDKTFINTTLAEMGAATTAMLQGMKAENERGQAKATATDSAGNKADFTFDLKVDATGERQQINGQAAERVVAVMETDMKFTPEGETKAEDAGKLVFVMDVWNTSSGPAYEAVQAFQRAAAKEIAARAFSGAPNLTMAFAQDPKMADAMKKAAEEARKMDGLAVRTTTYLVGVPPGLTFNRELALNPPKGPGAGNVARSAVGGALRGALGGLGGRKPQPEPEPAAAGQPAEAKQVTIMKLTTEVRDVQSKSLADALFQVPAGYREVPLTPSR